MSVNGETTIGREDLALGHETSRVIEWLEQNCQVIKDH